MKARVTFLTLGVDDLEASLRFYRDGLGLSTEGIIGSEYEYGEVVFFPFSAGLTFALYPRESLAKDAGIPVGPHSSTEFSIGHNVHSIEEVDTVLEQARNAGAVIVKQAQKTFWGGYAGYFKDPDGHLWEVVWNPQMLPAD